MQRLEAQDLHLVSAVEHPGHAVPTASHERRFAHLDEALPAGAALISLTVLCAFPSLVTVDVLTPIFLAIDPAGSPLRTPDSMTSLFSLLRCFPLFLAITRLLSARRESAATILDEAPRPLPGRLV